MKARAWKATAEMSKTGPFLVVNIIYHSGYTLNVYPVQHEGETAGEIVNRLLQALKIELEVPFV